jgi:hypothetical protein
MEPTLLHVEPKLLPGEIVSLIGIPPALGGKLTAFENFVAEIAASFQSEQTSTTINVVKSAPKREGPEGARGGAPPPGPWQPRASQSRPPLTMTRKAQASSAQSAATKVLAWSYGRSSVGGT